MDIVLADTRYILFTTRAFATGVPTVLAGTPVVSAYENDSITQITAGITLGVDHDGVVGLNLLTVVATGANGFEDDKDYSFVITTGTVGGVSVVGEVVGQFSIQRAPVNWANVSSPTTALDLSGTDIQLVDTATVLTNKTGFSLAATGLDAIVSTATGMVEIAKAIWDRVLTGATHNIATSAGRRLRGIQEFQGYENGTIWIDTVNGTAGTIDYENGTVENPVLTLADALTLNTSLGFNRFTIINGSTITLASTFNNSLFLGENWTLALGGQDTGGTHFHGASVTGIATGTETTFVGCHMGTCTIDIMHFENCSLSGTLTAGAVGDHHLSHCHSAIAGTATPVFDVGVGIANTNVNFRSYSGGIEFQNLGQLGTDTISLEGDGQVVLNANCVGGSINVRGNFELTDNSSTTTINDDARYDAPRHVDLTWDEVISKAAHDVGQSAAKILRQSGDLVQVDGAVSDVSPTTTGFDTNLTQVDDYFDDAVMIFSNGSANAGIGRPVSTYLNANGAMTFAAPDDWPVTPVNGDDFVIFATHVHPVAQIADAIWDESLSGHTTAGTTGKAISDIETNVAAILVDTDELQGDWTNGGRLDLILDAILDDTGTSGVVLTAAERIAIADAILDRDMSTGTDSGSPTVRTVRQALRANRNKVSISGGVMTVTKEDDSTTSWTAAITTTAGDPISAIDPA